jgi:hypothetical protein
MASLPKTLGPCPHELINRTLDLEIEAGNVVLSVRAEDHIKRDHPADYAVVMASLAQVGSNPGYIGQAPHHADNIEMVRRIVTDDTQSIVLVAIRLERNYYGNYNVVSAYCIREEQIAARLNSRQLLYPKKKAPV